MPTTEDIPKQLSNFRVELAPTGDFLVTAIVTATFTQQQLDDWATAESDDHGDTGAWCKGQLGIWGRDNGKDELQQRIEYTVPRPTSGLASSVTVASTFRPRQLNEDWFSRDELYARAKITLYIDLEHSSGQPPGPHDERPTLTKLVRMPART